MQMLIPVFWCPTWCNIKQWCQGKITKLHNPEQIHILGDCRYVVAKYGCLLKGGSPSLCKYKYILVNEKATIIF